MKRPITLLFATVCIFTAPLTAQGAWYWLANTENPELGDFVEMSALEYAETSIDHDLLYYIEDGFHFSLVEAKNSAACRDDYENVIEVFESNLITGTDGIVVFDSENIKSRAEYLQRVVETCLKNEARNKEIEAAIADCDFNFFENEMNNNERLDTWEERQACAKQEKVEIEVYEQEVLQVENAVPETNLDSSVPVKSIESPHVQDVEMESSSKDTTVFVPGDKETATDTDSYVEEQPEESTNNEDVTDVKGEEVVVPKQNRVSVLRKIVSFFTKFLPW